MGQLSRFEEDHSGKDKNHTAGRRLERAAYRGDGSRRPGLAAAPHQTPPGVSVRRADMVVDGEGLRKKDIRGNGYLDAASGAVWRVMADHGKKRTAKANEKL